MTDDLKNDLRALVDAIPPVSAREAITRSRAGQRMPGDPQSRRRRGRLVPAAAAVAVALVGTGIGWAAAGGGATGARTRPIAAQHHRVVAVLTAVEVHAISARSAAAASSSGTAQVTQTSAEDGVPQDGYDTAVTFSGKNIDEKITSVPQPPGSASSFTTDDRLADGQFYISTPGPSGTPEWQHDTNSANDAASMQFPDPRTLYQAISPAARFAVSGTTTMNGETVTRLVATDPGAISTAALGGLAYDATVTSFDLWVDPGGVVQQIELSTSQTNRTCRWGALDPGELRRLTQGAKTTTLPDGTEVFGFGAAEGAIGTALGRKTCGPMTTTSNTTVSFADLGVPQSITAPPGAVDFAGKG